MKPLQGDYVPFTLIGEEIAGDWNARALTDVARAFGGDYTPYMARAQEETPQTGTSQADGLTVPDSDLLDGFDWLMAAENGHDAQNIYALKPPVLQNCALVVGNEAKGLRRKTRKRAQVVAEIPLVSQNINCLNVAAAAAIMLAYLDINAQRALPLGQPTRTLAAVQKARPDVLLVGGRDPMELGSVVRSACAFGWEHVFLDDRHNAWYDCDRLMKSEGRGAARRGRNPIRVVPAPDDLLHRYKTVVVATRETNGPPLHQSVLTRRANDSTLIVLPDESEAGQKWAEQAQESHCLVHAHLPPIAPAQYHYRQAASIALAEIARQLGRAEGNSLYLRSRKQRYQKAFAEAETDGWIDLEDLRLF